MKGGLHSPRRLAGTQLPRSFLLGGAASALMASGWLLQLQPSDLHLGRWGHGGGRCWLSLPGRREGNTGSEPSPCPPGPRRPHGWFLLKLICDVFTGTDCRLDPALRCPEAACWTWELSLGLS